jgi:hypothetical protein
MARYPGEDAPFPRGLPNPRTQALMSRRPVGALLLLPLSLSGSAQARSRSRTKVRPMAGLVPEPFEQGIGMMGFSAFYKSAKTTSEEQAVEFVHHAIGRGVSGPQCLRSTLNHGDIFAYPRTFPYHVLPGPLSEPRGPSFLNGETIWPGPHLRPYLCLHRSSCSIPLGKSTVVVLYHEARNHPW